MANEVISINDFDIRNRILTIRGVQVMLDKDLAELYGVEVKQLNRQVKRNPERFPEDFMFQLSKDECLRCQIGTINGRRGEHSKYLPYAFTENGIAMLSSVLRSLRAIDVNIRIMRAFNTMRRALASIAPLLTRVDTIERRQITDQSKNAFRWPTRSILALKTAGNSAVNSPIMRFVQANIRFAFPLAPAKVSITAFASSAIKFKYWRKLAFPQKNAPKRLRDNTLFYHSQNDTKFAIIIAQNAW